MKFQDYEAGHYLPAQWVREVNQELKRLGRIHGAGSVTVSSGPRGFVIGGHGTPGTQTIIGKAKREEGSYPTLLDWSNGTQHTVWEFQKGDISYGTTYNPTITFTPADEPKYVKALNLAGGTMVTSSNKGHYIPENTLVALHEINGQWYCDCPLPDVITCSLTERFVAGESLECSTSLGTQTIYDYYLPSDYSIPQSGGFGGGTVLGVAALFKVTEFGGSVWKYCLIEAQNCPELTPEEE